MKKIPISHYINKKGWRHLPILCLITIFWVVIAYYGSREIPATAHAATRLIVYAFSSQEEVLSQGILPAFEKAWEAETGRELEIEVVFGPSAILAGQINLGAPADVAFFSNVHHVNWLKLGGMVNEDTIPSVIGYTPMVIVTRPGNPAEIVDFADLTQPGLCVLHADPRSSGAGEWAVLAEYGSVFLNSGNSDAAISQLWEIWRNVRVLGPSARASLTLFEMGTGDAFVTYEQDALLARERGVPLEIVIPPRTVIAQHVAVIVNENISYNEKPVVNALVQYLLSNAGQQIYRRYHMRSAIPADQAFPLLLQPFTVEDLGGWPHIHRELIETLWQSEIEPRLDLYPAPVLLDPGE